MHPPTGPAPPQPAPPRTPNQSWSSGPAPAPQPAPSSVWALPATGSYSDCSGRTPLPAGLYRDTCFPGIQLISHNWSYGANFYAFHVGSQVSYGGRIYTVYRAYYTTPPSRPWTPTAMAPRSPCIHAPTTPAR